MRSEYQADGYKHSERASGSEPHHAFSHHPPARPSHHRYNHIWVNASFVASRFLHCTASSSSSAAWRAKGREGGRRIDSGGLEIEIFARRRQLTRIHTQQMRPRSGERLEREARACVCGMFDGEIDRAAAGDAAWTRMRERERESERAYGSNR